MATTEHIAARIASTPGSAVKRSRLQKWKRQFQLLMIKAGLGNLSSVFISYQPDSQDLFAAHPEIKTLFQAFTKGNVKNNGGDVARLWSFILNSKQIGEEKISGDFAELGVWRGNTAAVLAYFAKQQGRKLFLFDTFQGFDAQDIEGVDSKEHQGGFLPTSINYVKDVIGDNQDACSLIQGYFPQSITEEAKNARYSLVSLDCDLYKPMKAGLEFFYPRMSTGGLFLLHDYSSLCWDGAKKAVDEFCIETGEYIVLMPDKSGSAFFRKTKQTT